MESTEKNSLIAKKRYKTRLARMKMDDKINKILADFEKKHSDDDFKLILEINVLSDSSQEGKIIRIGACYMQR